MITPEKEAEILRLHLAEKWPVGTIAKQLGLHHTTIRRALHQGGIEGAALLMRRSKIDPFVPLIRETFEKYPGLRASRLYQMAKERGYSGSEDHFRHVVAQHRPRRSAEAFLRLATLPGEEAQVDWGHFGRITIGKAHRALMAFVMVLSFSRQIFLRFFLGAAMANFIAGHVEAFAFFGGVPRRLLYDNLKSAVVERVGDAIRFHPELVALSRYYHFAPTPVAVARGNEKGRVERAIRYIRDNFFAARAFSDLADLNRQANEWSLGTSAERQHPDDRQRLVREIFAEERPRLLGLPEDPYLAHERREAHVGKTPYVRFDLNDYSLPHHLVRRTVVVQASADSVRILEGNEVVATHLRSFDAGRRIEDPLHIRALVEQKHHARHARGLDRLHHALPSAARLFQEVADRDGNLGALTSGLTSLLDRHGAEILERAVSQALQRQTPHLAAIKQLLDQERDRSGRPVPIAVQLPDDPRVRNATVRPHALESYDTLKESNDEDEKS